MVCHDAWFFGMHMLFHKVQCNPLLLHSASHALCTFSSDSQPTGLPPVAYQTQHCHLTPALHMHASHPLQHNVAIILRSMCKSASIDTLLGCTQSPSPACGRAMLNLAL